jgi:CRISPR-associated protein Cmr1
MSVSIARWHMRERLELTVQFVTPAFLGNAEQSGQWRTPPFKALLRQWWRVVYANGSPPNVRTMHQEEGRLFGRAADQGTTASLVRLRLDWRGGEIAQAVWNSQQAHQFESVNHPEVKDKNDRTKPVGTALYLGYGPVDVGNRLKRESAVASGQSRVLRVSVPATEEIRFKEVFRLIHLFGALGSRCRNGWGSLHFQKGGLVPEEIRNVLTPDNRAARDWLRRYARDWKEALDTDWCHALGKDEQGLLLWRTEAKAKWEDVLKLLAEVKIAFRTKFHFNGGGTHAAMCDRHVLAYPITNHGLGAWGKEARSANQVVSKVLRDGNSYVGLVTHFPHELPEALKRRLDADRRGLRDREIQVWTRVHQTLNEKLTRLL